jgi:hypothetical protein
MRKRFDFQSGNDGEVFGVSCHKRCYIREGNARNQQVGTPNFLEFLVRPELLEVIGNIDSDRQESKFCEFTFVVGKPLPSDKQFFTISRSSY